MRPNVITKSHSAVNHMPNYMDGFRKSNGETVRVEARFRSRAIWLSNDGSQQAKRQAQQVAGLFGHIAAASRVAISKYEPIYRRIFLGNAMGPSSGSGRQPKIEDGGYFELG
jgi:hypothetical protein